MDTHTHTSKTKQSLPATLIKRSFTPCTGGDADPAVRMELMYVPGFLCTKQVLGPVLGISRSMASHLTGASKTGLGGDEASTYIGTFPGTSPCTLLQLMTVFTMRGRTITPLSLIKMAASVCFLLHCFLACLVVSQAQSEQLTVLVSSLY